MERLVKVARTLRTREKYNGYLHLKVIPGSSDALVLEAAKWADRVSVNIELPSAASLSRIAPDKTPGAIFGPMRTIARAGGFEPRLPAPGIAPPTFAGQLPQRALVRTAGRDLEPFEAADGRAGAGQSVMAARKNRKRDASAAILPAGQTTQMVVGASPESDAVILTLAENLYLAYDVRRVYYSAFIPTGADPRLPSTGKPPLAREHRLYQADWLFRFYGFSADEILDPSRPFLDGQLDPKSGWALRNLHLFPVEIRTADYGQLLRVPGIGPKSASRIVAARRKGQLGLDALSRLGVTMRRAKWFITVGGKMASRNDPDASSGARELSGLSRCLERPEFLRSQLLDPAFRETAASQPDLPWGNSG